MATNKQKCVRCSWPCEEALFNSSINCTNSACPFFLSDLDEETRQLFLDLEKKCEELRSFQ
jgi:hypothetical protein